MKKILVHSFPLDIIFSGIRRISRSPLIWNSLMNDPWGPFTNYAMPLRWVGGGKIYPLQILSGRYLVKSLQKHNHRWVVGQKAVKNA